MQIETPRDRREVAPLIGITGPRLPASEIRSTPPILFHTWVDSHYVFYPRAVAAGGGLPVHLSREADPGALVRRLDAVLVAGGQDVDPRLYGSQPTSATTLLDPGRDEFELALIRAALDQGVPLLGVCRGAQLMNVALGGTLVDDHLQAQAIDHSKVVYPPDARVHPVRCVPGSVLHRIYGEELAVNSFHHQSIDRLGDGVAVTVAAGDGTVEAIEVDADAPAVGVQWHPEMLADPDPVFEWLVLAAAGR